MMTIIRAPLIAFGQFRALARERWAQAALRVVAVGGLALVSHLTVQTLIIAHVALIVVPVIFLWRAYARQSIAHDRSDLPMLRFGLMSFTSGLTGMIMLRLDQLFLAGFSTREQLGLYAAAVGLAEVPLFASNSIKVTLQGHITRTGSARAAYPFLAAIALSALLVPVAFLAAEPVIHLLYGKAFIAAAPMLAVLLTACIPAALLDLSGAALMALGAPKHRAIATSIAALATVCTLPFLAQSYGGMGAAISSLAAYASGATYALIALLRYSSGPRANAK
jgi:PST family polysaccharide transporter